MSDDRSRHDRLAVRLSLIISRLMAGESLSLKTLSDEFGVTERTLQRDFHQRLVHLDLEYRNGRYSLRRQSSPFIGTLNHIRRNTTTLKLALMGFPPFFLIIHNLP